MRLIDADELKVHISELILVYSSTELDNAILNAINNAPTVEQKYYERIIAQINPVIEERPHGEWIKWNFKTFGAMGDWEYKCSNCEKVYDGEYNFCPNCGADMRGNKNE